MIAASRCPVMIDRLHRLSKCPVLPSVQLPEACAILSRNRCVTTQPGIVTLLESGTRHGSAALADGYHGEHTAEPSASEGKAASQLAGADVPGGAAHPTPPQPAEQQSFSMTQTFLELPWHVVPFLFGMFALVEALRQGGWVDFFAGVRILSQHGSQSRYDWSEPEQASVAARVLCLENSYFCYEVCRRIM